MRCQKLCTGLEKQSNCNKMIYYITSPRHLKRGKLKVVYSDEDVNFTTKVTRSYVAFYERVQVYI